MSLVYFYIKFCILFYIEEAISHNNSPKISVTPFSITHFRNKRFMPNELFQWNAPQFCHICWNTKTLDVFFLFTKIMAIFLKHLTGPFHRAQTSIFLMSESCDSFIAWTIHKLKYHLVYDIIRTWSAYLVVVSCK